MNRFLSEESIRRHRDYLVELELRFSVLAKSLNILDLLNMTPKQIMHLPIGYSRRREALEYKYRIMAHKIYFASFDGASEQQGSYVSEYGRENAFLFSLLEFCKGCEREFAFVYKDRRGRAGICDDYSVLKFSNCAVIAIDLCEHAYFYDYGFNRREYLRHALAALSIKKIREVVF